MTTTKLRAILIPADPLAEITSVELVSTDGSTLRSLQTLVGGLIEAIAYPGRDDVSPYVNEEGKLIGLPRNERATSLLSGELFAGDWVSGDCVIAGFDPRSGETTQLPEDVTVDSLAAALWA